MKTKGRVLAVAAVVTALTIGSAGSGLAFGGWPYPGHTMNPALEEQKNAAAVSNRTDKAQDDEWGKNMPTYSWMEGYVETKRAEMAHKNKSEQSAQRQSVLEDQS